MGTIEIQIFGLVSAKASGGLAIIALVVVILSYLGYRLRVKLRR